MFNIVFIIALLVNKVAIKNDVNPYKIKIEGPINMKIDNFNVVENYGYLQTSNNKIHIIDVEKGLYKGSIYIKEEL